MKVGPSVKIRGSGDYITRIKGRLRVRNKKKPKNNQRQG